MSALPALGEPSEAAKAVVRELIFDDISDRILTVGALAVQISADAQRRDLEAVRFGFDQLRATAFAALVDIRRLDAGPP